MKNKHFRISYSKLSALPCLLLGVFLSNASAQVLLVANYDSSPAGQTTFIGKYNATNGSAIDANFVSIAGGTGPAGLASSGNTLYVSGYDSGKVLTYNLTTGAAINTDFITGMTNPYGMVVSGGTLFVADPGDGMVKKFDVTTGASLGGFTVANSSLTSLAISGNNLYVGSESGNVGLYNATTGATIIENFNTTGFSSSVGVMLLGSDLYFVSQFGTPKHVRRVNATTGASVAADSFIDLGSTLSPYNLATDGSSLFVSYTTAGRIDRYDASTGALITANFITGLTNAEGMLYVSAIPEPSTYVLLTGLATLGMVVFRRRRA